MATHRFEVNVPNPTPQNVSVQLRLDPARPSDLSWLPREWQRLDLQGVNTCITLDPCIEEGKTDLQLKLEPFASVDVHIVVNTVPSKKPSVAAFHLVDRRQGKDMGGVLLVCTDPPFAEPRSQVVSTAKPCPAVLAKDIYAIRPGDDPSKSSRAKTILAGDTVELVAQITNPTDKSIKDAKIYLEHLGVSNAAFMPGTWNMGTLAKGDVFYATWPIRTTAWQVGSFNACLVVVSQGMDPVRLNGTFKLAPRQEDYRGNDR
jgi:hypothetical protein